ncbi:MAG: DUF4861 domain-containing protein [Dysgonamonadaceae bacterium]|jgi:hypothetical protein|nr:DUF4861 domain-containing protein [Dysgonamonadaceae bacterium]
MKKIIVIISLWFTISQIQGQEISLTLRNQSDKKLTDCTIELSQSQLKKLPLGNYKVQIDGREAPLELITNLQGETKAVFPVAVINPKENKHVKIVPGQAIKYPKRTYAELSHKIGGHFEGHEYKGDFSWVKPNYLRVPDNFRDHAYYIKYEGPGWESDKAGFRFYLDQRNAIDVFGKKTPGIVLPFVGVDNYETYHHPAIWGMDNMKVGSALGIGSIAVWDGKQAVRVEKTDSVVCYIPADGKVRSQVMTNYYGWDANGTKCNLKSLISIDAGSRASHIELLSDKEIKDLATGINKDKNVEFFTNIDSQNEWSYIATFGKQSLNDDNLGLALFVRTKQIKTLTEDSRNHVVILSQGKGYVDYYIMPAWESDWEPVVTKTDFLRCIEEVMNRLNNTPKLN